jgi:haloalkane dehalogenase
MITPPPDVFAKAERVSHRSFGNPPHASFASTCRKSVCTRRAAEIFRQIRTAAGEELVLNQNLFVEQILPGAVIRPLGEPADVAAIMNAYAAWLAASNIPKLFINAEPGIVLSGPNRDFCRTWANQSEVTVPGVHFVQEDSGPEIGRAVGDWIRNFRSH